MRTKRNKNIKTSNNFLLSGATSSSISVSSGKIRVEVNQGSKTITLANYNNNVVFINTGTGGGGGVITLPSVLSALGYTFTFRSVQATATTTIQQSATDTTNCILLTNASAYTASGAVASYVVTAGNSRTFISDGSFWVQI